MALPLEGVPVVELSHIVAGPFCGSILADYGANLIKTEAPGVGGRGRTSPPFIPDTDPPVCGSFYALSRSRRGLALNGAGSEVLQNHVCPRREFPEHPLPLGVLQVDGKDRRARPE